MIKFSTTIKDLGDIDVELPKDPPSVSEIITARKSLKGSKFLKYLLSKGSRIQLSVTNESNRYLTLIDNAFRLNLSVEFTKEFLYDIQDYDTMEKLSFCTEVLRYTLGLSAKEVKEYYNRSLKNSKDSTFKLEFFGFL